MASKQIEDLMNKACEETKSQISYFAAYDELTETLTMIGWSNTAMANCKLITKPLIYILEDTGLWGDAVRERKPVVTNDYKSLSKPTKKGYPEGHVTVVRHFNIPVIEGGKVVAVLGVGNKPTNYEDADVQKLTQAANAAWPEVKKNLGI